jgi:hypothetical protein
MSRSRRKTTITGITTAATEQADKRSANRSERRRVRSVLNTKEDIQVLPAKRELSDVWAMAKDGKTFFDASKNPKLMRK